MMRLPGILLALGLVLLTADVMPSSARAGRCPKENTKKFFKKADECPREYIEQVTAMTNGKPFFTKARSLGALRLAKHADGYYLVLFTANKPYKGDIKVRAKEDPLMFKFEDGTDITLYIDKDTSSGQKMTWERFCGFYDITEEQLQSVQSKKVVEIAQFVVAEGEKFGRRLEEAEDGRTFYRWPVNLSKNQKELADQAACVLTF
jgi:hypothetical protein